MAYSDYERIAFKNGKHIKDLSAFNKPPFVMGGIIDLNITNYTEYADFGNGVWVGYYNSEVGQSGHRANRRRTMVEEYFVYKCNEYTAIFYIKNGNSLVALSGSRHYGNPFLHYYDRGLGAEQDKMILSECYFWLCSKVLNEILTALVIDKNVHPFDTENRLRKALRFKQ